MPAFLKFIEIGVEIYSLWQFGRCGRFVFVIWSIRQIELDVFLKGIVLWILW
jgi:hypothetical protein